MEPLDTDMEYMVHPSQPMNPATRFNVMLIFPILGALLILLFISAAVFQIDLSNFVDVLAAIMLVLFAVFIIAIFWAMSPRVRHDH
jgi:hypothetical protein